MKARGGHLDKDTDTQYRGKSDGMAAGRERNIPSTIGFVYTVSQCTAGIVVSLFSWELNWLSEVVLTIPPC